MNPVSEQPLLPTANPASISGILVYIGSLAKQLRSIFSQHGFRINRLLPKDGSEAMTGPLELAPYATAAIPAAADHEGTIIYVSDASAGSKFQGSDGTNWVNLG